MTNQSSPKRTPRIPKWQDALAGAFAGAFSKTSMAPVERVKLMMQLQGSAHGMTGKGPVEVATQIYRSEGVLAFWRGNWPNVLRTAGQAALNFSFMDYYKSLASSPSLMNAMVGDASSSNDAFHRWRQLVTPFLSGALAGATSTTALYPTEFLRTRLAMDQGRSSEQRQYRNMRDATVKIFKSDGIAGLYQGYGIACSISSIVPWRIRLFEARTRLYQGGGLIDHI